MGRKRLQLGDIIEIETAMGLAYFQFTHYIDRFGAVVRVFDGLLSERPSGWEALSAREVTFTTLLPLQAMVSKRIVEIVWNAPVRDELKGLPLFRAAQRELDSDKVRSWWLWDGEEEWPVDALAPSEQRLPLRATINDTQFIDWIESGWRDGDDMKSGMT